MYHTLGQRKGLGVGGLKDAPEEPWFAAKKDLERNVLIAVQGHQHPLLMSKSLRAKQMDWVASEAPAEKFSCTAKTRYRQADVSCTVSRLNDDDWLVEFDEQQRAVTPGQSVVFYDGEVCLGGGIIESTQH